MDVGPSALENVGMNFKRLTKLFLVFSMVTGCASKVLKYDNAEQLKDNKEFDAKVKIVAPEEVPGTNVIEVGGTTAVAPKPVIKIPPPKKIVRKKGKKEKRLPELESDEGFQGRRPLVDPFKVGEKVVHTVSYLGMNAGSLTMEVRPIATVNGKRSYNFRMAINSSPLFSHFYNTDDFVTTLVDYETLVPSVFTLHVKETAQLREGRAFYDSEKGLADFWEKKVTEKDGEEEKKLQWELPAYSQNVYSSVFYLRNFQWPVGRENAFRVADTGENLVFRAKAIRKEKLSTAVGDFNAIVIKPEITLQGKYKPVGDIFIWISDDDRKILLRIESKIKIGTLISEISFYEPGRD